VQLRAKQIALGNIRDEIKAGAKNLYKEHEKSKQLCERSEALYRQYSVAYRAAALPNPPACIKLSAVSPTSVMLTIDDPKEHGGAVITRYKGVCVCVCVCGCLLLL
jgi:hypothetical protein